MNKFDILEGDCMELIKQQPDNSIDLVVTSPPYTDIINYGKEVSIKKPEEYVDWLLPLFTEIYRVLKPTGSFILNINDNCKNGLRNTFVYELIYRSGKETPLKLYDTYIWHKRNGIPNGSKRRVRNTTEFIFHFCKDQKQLKFYMDRILREPKESYSNRLKHPETISSQGKVVNGIRIEQVGNHKTKKIKYMTGQQNKTRGDGYDPPVYYRELPKKVRPDNVVRFRTAGTERDNTIKHPAPFNKELPEYFIKFLTDEGDVVLDPFSGIGTTGIPCIKTNRHYIGYELNKTYADFSIQRLNGEELDFYEVCQYDLDDNLIACYKNRMEASRSTGINEVDIMRTYNRTKFDSRGGYKWKLKKKE